MLRDIRVWKERCFFAAVFLSACAGLPLASDAAVISVWNFNGNLVDSVSGYNGTFNGTSGPVYATISGHETLSLDGVDNYVSVAANGNNLDFNQESFTIATWLYVNGVPTERREAILAGKFNDSSLSDYAITIDYNNRINEGDGYLASYGYTGPGGGAGSVGSIISYGTYLNLVLTYDQPTGTLSLYRNGVLQEAKSGLTGPVSSSVDLLFGRFAGTYLAANLDEIQMYDNTMNQSQITALYNNGDGPLPVPEPSSAGCLAAALAGCFFLWRTKSGR